MAKSKSRKPKREPTKRQLSRWQKQKRRQRIILAIGILIVVAVFAVLGVGWYVGSYQPLHQTVVRVNDTKFSMDYYLKTLEYYGAGQADYGSLYYLADEVATVIQRNELLRQKAPVSVSDSQVSEELESRGFPSGRVYRDLVRGEMLLSKMRDEYFEQEVPVVAEQRHIMAMFLESESQAVEVSARLEGGEDFSELAGELSLDTYSKSKKGDMGWMPEGIAAELLDSEIAAGSAFSAEVGVLSQLIHDETKSKRVGYWIAIKLGELEKESEADQANVKAILLGSEEEALSVKARLEAGEDFAALAKELSLNEASRENGGDLGWVAADTMSPAFNYFIDTGELGKLSKPLRDDSAMTEGGYWLLKVLDKEDDREIEKGHRDLLKNIVLSDWLSTLMDDPENRVENYLDDEKKAWAIKRLLGIE